MEQSEKLQKVLELIPFTPTSQTKLSLSLKNEVSDTELFLILSNFVQDGKIKMTMGPKGPEYYREWDSSIDEERKKLSKEFNTRFDDVIFFPRFDGYVANIEDNFIFDDWENALACFRDISSEYVLWHKNQKTGLVYPPKLNAINSSIVLSLNVTYGLGVDPSQVEYAANFEALAPEPMRDRPEEISAPVSLFDTVINYEDSIDYVQSTLLEQFYQPSRPGLWAFQYGDRFLFDNDEAIELIRSFAKKLNPVYFDVTELIKGIVAIYSDILASPEEYKDKKVSFFKICFDLGKESKYQLLAKYSALYNAEAKELEIKVNELLKSLPLPEGVSFEYQYLLLSEVVESLPEESREYFKKRYLNF